MENSGIFFFMKFLVITFLFLITLNAYPHPHVFIDVEADVEIKDGKINSITQRWVFDEMFSSMVLMDYDKNRNKRIDLNEIMDMTALGIACALFLTAGIMTTTSVTAVTVGEIGRHSYIFFNDRYKIISRLSALAISCFGILLYLTL